MVAAVGLADQLVDFAVRDLIEHAVALADRDQDGVEHLVDALDDLAVRALERRGVAALIELALAAELGQLAQFRLELLQHQRDPVDVLLHLLVVAAIGLHDQLIYLAVRDLVEHAVAFADRQQRGVEQLVDRRQQGFGVARSGLDVGARRQQAAADRLGQPLQFQQLQSSLMLSAQPQE